jgi:hypothetical protein
MASAMNPRYIMIISKFRVCLGQFLRDDHSEYYNRSLVLQLAEGPVFQPEFQPGLYFNIKAMFPSLLRLSHHL